ncbi:MAG: hypothetical protein OXG67_01595 [bacterium]|nr:hypothetical protein [bacterium]
MAAVIEVATQQPKAPEQPGGRGDRGGPIEVATQQPKALDVATAAPDRPSSHLVAR